MKAIEEYHREFFKEISDLADETGAYKEDAFFDYFTDYLVEAGEFDHAERAYHRRSRGVRVDGYTGDPLDNPDIAGSGGATFGLFVMDFSQGRDLATLTNSDMQADFRRLHSFLEKSIDPSFRNSLEPSDPGFGLADLICKRWEKISRINFYLLTNKQLSARIQGKEAGSLDGRQIQYNVWDISRFAKLEESGREREELTIDFHELPSGPIRTLLASAPGSPNEVYLTAVPGESLARIYDRWGTRLLEQNVRVFLQARSKVNKGIKRTIENEPQLFFSFNNGITATAESLDIEHIDGIPHLARVTNLQIVNGGQTTASVYAAYRAKRDLSDVYVQMKMSCVSPDEAKELVPRISEYANSQNRVSPADFFANHPYHVRVETMSKRVLSPAKNDSFIQTHWFYERARGSYRDAQAYLTAAKKSVFVRDNPKSQVFSKTDLAKYLMVWTETPYIVNRGAQKNFAAFANLVAKQWEVDEAQFSEQYFRELIAKKIIFDETARVVQGREWYEAGGYRAQHVVLTVGLIAYAAKSLGRSVNFQEIWNDQSVGLPMQRALAQAADVVHGALMSPGSGYANISEWAKQERAWNAIKQTPVTWDGQWLSELISSEEAKEQARSGKRDQKVVNAIQAQKVVIEKGDEFWREVIEWCKKEGEGTPKDLGILSSVAKPGSMPSERQAIHIVKFMRELGERAAPFELNVEG